MARVSIDPAKSVSAIASDIRASSAEGNRYVAFHAPRYALLLKILARRGRASKLRVLDIGTSVFTRLLRDTFDVRVDTLDLPGARHAERGHGFADSESTHYEFDLNDVGRRAAWPALPTYDVVLLCEVIEHLRVPPQEVFAFIAPLMADGGDLVVQTPNAVALNKRVKMLLGRNPYELLRADVSDPGHIREYTRTEIERIAHDSGFDITAFHFHSYFDNRFRKDGNSGSDPGGVLRNALHAVVPPGWRPGMTAELRLSRGAL